MSADVAAAALARNDRYLVEIVEHFELCPYARRCRETGGLERRVLLQTAPDAALLRDALAELCGPAFDHVEVALLILPQLAVTPSGLERFASQLREVAASVATPAVYHLVAFHPEGPADATGPHRLVPFLRRSPDPTIQLVRASLLDRVRGPDLEDTIYLDPATVDPVRLDPPRKSVSTRIAEANLETVRRVGLEAIERHLNAIRRPAGRL
jgi:hypothetical protein